MKNLSADPAQREDRFNGPTLPPKEGGRGADRQVLAGYRHDGEIAVVPHPVEEFKKDKQETLEVSKSDKGPLAWVGPCSVYFNALVLPLKNDPNAKGDAAVGDFIEKVTAKVWKLDDEERQRRRPPRHAHVRDQAARRWAPTSPSRCRWTSTSAPSWRKVLDDAALRRRPAPLRRDAGVKSGWCGSSAPSTG